MISNIFFRRAAGVAAAGCAIAVFLALGGGEALPAQAATNISATTTMHWAWNDTVGWIDFYNTNTVVVTSTEIQGYASSSLGDFSLDCATTRIGNICGTSDYGVTNEVDGDLSGYGWNDVAGWISFDCANHGGCGVSAYQVYLDGSGNFHDYAWNETIGWISFNCANHGGCGVDYKVNSSWVPTLTLSGYLDSSMFDTGVSSGAQLNSVVWQGDQPVDTDVGFQFAVSNASSGPWTFYGPSGSTSTAFEALEGVSKSLDYLNFNNYRYFRYRVYLYSDDSGSASPRIDDIIVNWSR